MTRTALEAGSVGISASGNEPKNPHPERETGELCERLEAKRLLTALWSDATIESDEYVNPDGPEASSTIRAQAAELERLRGALREIEALPNMSRDPVDEFDRGARAARLDAADIAALALSPNTSEQST